MAIGFPPSYEESAEFRVPERDLLQAVQDALDDLCWSFYRDGRWRFVAIIPFQFFVTPGEKISIAIEERGLVVVRSETSNPLQWIDWGRNRSNVRQFFAALEDMLDEQHRRRKRRMEEIDE